MSELPKVPSKWKHYKGNEYEVYDLLNTDADPGRELDHPVIVCYRGANGRKWGKTLEVFLKTMTPIEQSAWQARKERINEQFVASATSLQAPAFANVRDLTIPAQDQMQLLVPRIRVWDSANPHAIGAYAHVRTKEPVAVAIKEQFIADLWTAAKGQHELNSFAYRHIITDWADRVPLGMMNADLRDHVARHHATFIGLYNPGRPVVSTWTTSYGGSLYELTVFMSILRHVSQKYAGEFYDNNHVRMIARDFNDLVEVAVRDRVFHPRMVPNAVVYDLNRLRFLLPKYIMGPEDDTPKYVETTFANNVLTLMFDKPLTLLIEKVFGVDCLVRTGP